MRVYLLNLKKGKNWCKLLCTELEQQNIAVASVFYWKRFREESLLSLKHFPSKSPEDTIRKAKSWIEKNLFKPYAQQLLK